jgi:subtilisin family serine protease
VRTWITLEDAAQALRSGDGSGVSIAIIDSGIEISHPALAGVSLIQDIAIVPEGHKLTVFPGEGTDLFGHGTAVASIIHSIAPNAALGSIRALGLGNSSKTEIIHRGAQEALNFGYKILNCSFGCAAQHQVLGYKSWVDEAYLKGVHIAAACNNDDFRIPEWPAYFSSVISVNMISSEDDQLFYFEDNSLIEFKAKGVDVKVPWSGGREKVVTGSSFATPRLAAVLARLLSVYPDLSPTYAKSILHKLAKRVETPG